MLVEIVDEGNLSGLGKVPGLQNLLSSTQQYGPALRQILTSAGVQLPAGPTSAAISPEAIVRVARQTAANDVAQILKRHEAAARKRFSTEAGKLAKAGVPRQEIERRVRSAIEKLPATQARRAVQELTKAGSVSKKTAAALSVAKKLYPGVQKQIDKVTAPVRKIEKTVKDVRSIAKKIPAPLRRPLDKFTQPLRKEAERAGKKVVKDVVQSIGGDQAKKLAQDTLRKMNLPNIPVVLPTSLTPEGVRDAAYGAGKKYLEGAMQSAIGISIPLPTKLSAKAIEKSLTGLLPKDAKEALEKGLDIGTQIGASALSSALVGATIGSAIPGLGTVIGIGVAIGVNALKGALKKALTEKHASQQRCKAEDKFKVKLPELSPLELIPWIAKKKFDMSKAVAEEERKTKCGLTPYSSGLRNLGQQSFEIAKSTIPVLGLPQLDKLIPLYDRAPKQEWFWDKGKIQPGGAIVGGTRKVLIGPSATGYDIAILLKMMQDRRAKLQSLVNRSTRIGQLAPSEMGPLRWEIVTEIGNAAMQYQLTGGADSKKWLQQLGGYMQRLVKAETSAQGAMKSRYEQDLRREAELRKQGKTGVVTGII